VNGKRAATKKNQKHVPGGGRISINNKGKDLVSEPATKKPFPSEEQPNSPGKRGEGRGKKLRPFFSRRQGKKEREKKRQ